MCGIAGIAHIGGRTPDERVVRRMCDAIAHRGPDGEGFHVSEGVGLGHRRLAIIDLSTGDQPIFNEDGRVAVVFNGEIYNFREVRSALETAGHRFATQSDTEVLVHAWEEWGTAMCSHLNGMFAFGIHDQRTKKLFLARDRLGVKPLYYWQNDGSLAFASELGALLASGIVPRRIDAEALDLYLHYQYVPSPWTIYRDVRKLAPGEWLELDLRSGESRIESWWALGAERRQESGQTLEAWRDELETVLEDATRIRLVSDVPFGAFLSGGIDSGIVVALMAARMTAPVQTFSIGLDGSPDELERARLIAKRFGTEHREFRVSPEGLALVPRLARHFGEPFADSSAIPTYYVSKIARQNVKMVLTGDGGDEMFAGYRSYSVIAGGKPGRLQHTTRVPLPNSSEGRVQRIRASFARARSVMAWTKRRLLGQTVSLHARGSLAWSELYDRCMSHFLPEERRALLGKDAPLSPSDWASSRYHFDGADSVVAAAQFCDLHTYLPGDILTKVDRMSMANSLEVRSPLLDYRVAELAFRMPTQVKLPIALSDGSKGKYVLKELAARHLGADYVYAPKVGFGIPVSKWLREDRDGLLRDSLLGSDSPIFGWLDRNEARRYVEQHLAGAAEYPAKVWNLLMLDAWFRHVDADSASAASSSANAR